MTIHSIGSDLARIDRLEAAHERRGQRLLDRLFTEREQAYCDRRAARFTHYAGRFAVKEAVMKVLGTGWTSGVRWVDIEVVRGRRREAVPHSRAHAAAIDARERELEDPLPRAHAPHFFLRPEQLFVRYPDLHLVLLLLPHITAHGHASHAENTCARSVRCQYRLHFAHLVSEVVPARLTTLSARHGTQRSRHRLAVQPTIPCLFTKFTKATSPPLYADDNA